MRFKEFLTEEFVFDSKADEEDYKTLISLVKYNNGVFKSAKQADFLFGKKRFTFWRDDKENLKNWFNIDLNDGEIAAQASAHMRWADYGFKKSAVPVSWYFVIDKNGVVRQYKLGYKSNGPGAWSPDEKKTKLVWERDEKAAEEKIKELEKKPEEKPTSASTSTHLGKEKERMEFDLTLDRVMELEPSAWGPRIWHAFKTPEGNIVYYTGGYLNDFTKKGDHAKVKATVKRHILNKQGDKVTVIERIKVV